MPPRAMALMGPTKPAAGVIATRPTTIAVAAPTAVGFLARPMSKSIQTTSVAAGSSIVVVNARAANPLAAKALPALKPNHPNHRNPAARSVNGCYAARVRLTDSRAAVHDFAATRAAMPALTCTTVPPAKSRAPIWESQPPPHTQWAIGLYTTIDHNDDEDDVGGKSHALDDGARDDAAVIIANVP